MIIAKNVAIYIENVFWKRRFVTLPLAQAAGLQKREKIRFKRNISMQITQPLIKKDQIRGISATRGYPKRRFATLPLARAAGLQRKESESLRRQNLV